MRQTKERESSCRLAVDIEGLAAMLSCGQMTARKIGEPGSPSDAGYCTRSRRWKNIWKR